MHRRLARAKALFVSGLLVGMFVSGFVLADNNPQPPKQPNPVKTLTHQHR